MGWLFVVVGALIVLFGIFFVFKLRADRRKGIKHKIDYYAFFIMGIFWVGAGISLGIGSNNWGLFIMGLVFMGVGLAHKDEWKKNHRTWKQLDSKERKLKIWILLALGIIFLLGVVFYFLSRTGMI